MPDLLVRLYDLPSTDAVDALRANGIDIRRALSPERELVTEFSRTFYQGWAAETAVGFAGHPISVFVAVRAQELLGFACYDTTMKGFFGPTGVREDAQKQGIGEALLLVTLKAMFEAGYGYGVIGDPGPIDWYRKRLDAMEIPKSEPGVYRGMLRKA